MGNLVVGRRVGERTVIVVPPSQDETRIDVDVADTRRDECRLAFMAPAQVRIWREELLRTIEREARITAKENK